MGPATLKAFAMALPACSLLQVQRSTNAAEVLRMQLGASSERVSPCRYWQAFQRLVLLGWTEDARDVLYVHSDLPDAEERLLQQNKVSNAILRVLWFVWHYCKRSQNAKCVLYEPT